jgi:uncharacterized metal-binding protein YceD (DUF177 family)
METMVEKKQFEIPFSGLKLGSHRFDFKIEDSFFEDYDLEKLNNVDVSIAVHLEKKANMLVLKFELEGQIALICDRCTDQFIQKINHDFDLIVRFSDIVDESDNEELLILSHNDHTVSLDDYFHEFVLLSLPTKRVHSDIEDCNQEIINKIKEMGFDSSEQEEEIDPRWEDLKKIKTKK